MSVAHRTAARIVSKGLKNGKAAGHLAMDTLDVTGLVMTSSLNAVITDSSPGMSSYVTGQKGANNQEGVYPDNTADAFDNPRVEYIGELLRRTRGPGFNVGIVTTADVTDSTPAANAAHTSDRFAAAGIAAQFFDERASNGISVLMGGGARHFMPKVRRRAGRWPQAGRGVHGGRIPACLQRGGCKGADRRQAGAAESARTLSSIPLACGVRQGGSREVQRRAGPSAERGVSRHADARRSARRWRSDRSLRIHRAGST